MTREKHPAAYRAAHRAASLLTGALLLAGLTGCAGGLFQNSDTADATLKAKPTVALSSAEGVPPKYAAKVNEQLTASLKANGIAIADAKDAVYVIKPSYAAKSEPKHGTRLAYNIDITDKAGNKIRSLGGEEIVSPKHGGDSWVHVNDESMQRLAAKSATDLTVWIENPNTAPAVASAAPAPEPAPVKVAAHTAPKHAPAAQPAEAPQTASLAAAVAAPAAAPAKPKAALAPAELVAVVPAVTGAPGDGKTALAEAMKRALKQAGIKLTSAAKAGAYKIQGQVELGAAANGQQPIIIRWVVLDPSGKQMEKTVVQNNKIVAGSLDGAWGEVADQAAGAAASEVTKLLQKPASGQAQQGATGSAG